MKNDQTKPMKNCLNCKHVFTHSGYDVQEKPHFHCENWDILIKGDANTPVYKSEYGKNCQFWEFDQSSESDVAQEKTSAEKAVETRKFLKQKKMEGVYCKYVGTNEAAVMLNRSPQTLRGWAMRKNGPIIPIQIKKSSPLLWRRDEIEKLLNDPDLKMWDSL